MSLQHSLRTVVLSCRTYLMCVSSCVNMHFVTVVQFISGQTSSKMFVIHLDETNHLAATQNEAYLVAVMQQLYRVMGFSQYFVPCLFTGTNASFLISLKASSSSINLPPLAWAIIVDILVHIVSNVCVEFILYSKLIK